MGADLCLALFCEPLDKDFKPDWNKGYEAIDAYVKAGVYNHLAHLSDDPEELTNTLKEKLDTIKDAYEKGSRELTELEFPPYKIYVTGGMSWGDSPSEIYNDINDLEAIDILNAVGFNQVPDYQRIIQDILSKKEILPLLMSINPVLDALISKALNTKSKRKKK